mmetsp:Transcript_4460/g.12823  ORF Transcript_4460/g.12823 Transcript_4460/m.12823 type:complete len:284 (-) Transcript_4460:295-1146(-)
MDLLAVADLGEDRGLGALLGHQQMLMDSTDGDEGGQCDSVRSGEFVGKDDACGSLVALHLALDGIGSLVADSFKRGQHPIRATSCWERNIDDGSLELILIVLQCAHLLEGQHRMIHHQAFAMALAWFGEKIALRTDRAGQAHDDLFTDRIDRWIGHLREELLEVVVDLAWLFGEDGERGIVAHASQCLLSSYAHWHQQHFELFAGETEHVELAVGALEVHWLLLGAALLGPLGEIEHAILHPLLVRFHGGDLLLDFVVRDDALGFEIDQEHLSWFEPVLDLDL